jgi:hypothetical protein
MTQAQQTADGFFSGGGKAVKFTTVGDSVTGIVAAVHQPEQQTTPGDNMPVFDKKTGAPKMQIRIELETDQRDPSDEWDDGRRTLYCRGWMKGAIGDALRRAGASGAPADRRQVDRHLQRGGTESRAFGNEEIRPPTCRRRRTVPTDSSAVIPSPSRCRGRPLRRRRSRSGHRPSPKRHGRQCRWRRSSKSAHRWPTCRRFRRNMV